MEDVQQVSEQTTTQESNESSGYQAGSIKIISENGVSATTQSEAATSDNVEQRDQQEVNTQAQQSEDKPVETGATESSDSVSSEAEAATKSDADESSKTDTGDGKSSEQKMDFGDWLKEKTNGRFSDENAFVSYLEQQDKLAEDFKKPKEPEFPNERAKKAYEFIQESKLEFADALQQYRHIMAIDTEKMSDVDLQRSAYILQNPDLGDDAGKLFDIERKQQKLQMEDEDVDEDTKELFRLRDKAKTNEARKFIKEQQDKLKVEAAKEFEKQPEADTQSTVDQEQIDKWHSDVNKATEEFSKFEVRFGENKVGVDITKDEVNKINAAMKDPTSFWNENVARPDMSVADFRNNIAKIVNFDKLMEQAYQNGVSQGQVKFLDEKKNLDETKTVTAAPEVRKEPGFFDAWRSASTGKQ